MSYTVAEAAAQLGISPRRLRRLLERPEYAAQTGRTTRRTRTGTRTATTLPPCLVEEIGAQIATEGNGANGAQGNEAGTGQEPGEQGAPERGIAALGDMRLAALYERQVQRQAEEIAFLRDALRREQENHARTQALLALQAPLQPSAPAEQTRPAGPGARRRWWRLPWRR